MANIFKNRKKRDSNHKAGDDSPDVSLNSPSNSNKSSGNSPLRSTTLGGAVGGLSGGIGGLASSAGGLASNAGGHASNAASGALSTASNSANGAYNSISNSASGAFNSASNSANGALNSASNAANGAYSSASGAGSNFVNYGSNAVTASGNQAKQLPGNVLNALNSPLQTQGNQSGQTAQSNQPSQNARSGQNASSQNQPGQSGQSGQSSQYGHSGQPAQPGQFGQYHQGNPGQANQQRGDAQGYSPNAAASPSSPSTGKKNVISSPLSQHSETPWAEYAVQRAVPSPRFGHSANYVAARDGELFIMGGIREMDILNDLWVIDTKTLTGYQLVTDGHKVGPRVGHASLVLGNAHVVFGGDTKIEENDPLDDNLYLLNTSSLKWTVAQPQGPRPHGRYGHSLSNVGARVYIFGGQVDEEFYDDMWAFDLTTWRSPTAKWERIHPATPPPPARTNHTVVTYEDKIYLFGGANGDLWYSDTWSFDPVTRVWKQLECSGYVPAPCQGHAATIIGDVMYVFGGMSSQGLLIDQLFALKLTTLKWYTFQNLGPGPSPRSGHSVTAFGGDKVLVWGGTEQGNSAYVLDVSRINYPDDNADARGTPATGTNATSPAMVTSPSSRSVDQSTGSARSHAPNVDAPLPPAPESSALGTGANSGPGSKTSPGYGDRSSGFQTTKEIRELQPHVYAPQSSDFSGPTQAKSSSAARNSMLFSKRRSVLMPGSPVRDNSRQAYDTNSDGNHIGAGLAAGAAGAIAGAAGALGIHSLRNDDKSNNGTRAPNRDNGQVKSYVTEEETDPRDERFVSATDLDKHTSGLAPVVDSKTRGHSRGLSFGIPHPEETEQNHRDTLTADNSKQFRSMEKELHGMPGGLPDGMPNSDSNKELTDSTQSADFSRPTIADHRLVSNESIKSGHAGWNSESNNTTKSSGLRRSQPQTNLSLNSIDGNEDRSLDRSLEPSTGAAATHDVSGDSAVSAGAIGAGAIGAGATGAGAIGAGATHGSINNQQQTRATLDSREQTSSVDQYGQQGLNTNPNISSQEFSKEHHQPVVASSPKADNAGTLHNYQQQSELTAPLKSANSQHNLTDSKLSRSVESSAGSDTSTRGATVGAGAGAGAGSVSVSEELASLRRQLDTYRQRDLDNEHHQLRQSHAQQQRELTNLRDANAQLSRKHATLSSQSAEHKQRYDQLESVMDGHVKTLQSQQVSLDEANAKLRQYEFTQSENADLKLKLQTAEAAQRHAQEQLEAISQSYGSLKSAHSDLSARHLANSGNSKDPNNPPDSQSRLNDQVSHLVTVWDQFKLPKSNTRDLNETSSGENYRQLYEVHREASERAHKELDAAYQSHSSLKSQLRELSALYANSPSQADVDLLKEQHNSALSSLDNKHQTTLRSLNQQSSSLEDLRARLARLEKSHSELQTEYNKAVDLSRNQQVALNKTREELNISRAHAQRLEEQVEDASLQNTSHTEHVTEGGDLSHVSVGSNRNDQAALVIRDLRAQVVILEEEMQNQREQIMRLKKAALTN